MKVNLHLTPTEIHEEKLKDTVSVVVDVLRASTTICAALGAGAKEVIPADSTAGAIQLASILSNDTILLCGEREGRIVEGFDLGNSPFQYKPSKVKGKTLIFSSTNGTPVIVKTRQALKTYIGGFVNLDVVVNALKEETAPVHIICAGRNIEFAIEDAVCAGLIILELERRLKTDLELNDGATAAAILADKFRNKIPEIVANSHHGRYLTEIGAENDLPFCADLNRLPLLPVFNDGRITANR
ncbi:2-phosphosulfolactate phosphatase [bacterium]|nr:2-phosphosulfolactate phosphatase [bacterium]MBU1651437.1 2-phosphosulfolactate phosphatase [bacterium]MBU1881670.1 2-phosphosulfolactate phosphatase [bacterium]